MARDGDQSSILARLGGFLWFFAMTMACFVWFTWSGYNIVGLIFSEAHVVYLDEGSLYMFGAGVGLASLTFAILYEGILRRKLTKTITKFIARSALVGIALMFTLPHLLHYLAGIYLAEKNYTVCDEQSYQWLVYRKIVYTNSQRTCELLSQEMR